VRDTRVEQRANIQTVDCQSLSKIQWTSRRKGLTINTRVEQRVYLIPLFKWAIHIKTQLSVLNTINRISSKRSLIVNNHSLTHLLSKSRYQIPIVNYQILSVQLEYICSLDEQIHIF
jgi:hypothetical protein